MSYIAHIACVRAVECRPVRLNRSQDLTRCRVSTFAAEALMPQRVKGIYTGPARKHYANLLESLYYLTETYPSMRVDGPIEAKRSHDLADELSKLSVDESRRPH
jgi:hypothetical protein